MHINEYDMNWSVIVTVWLILQQYKLSNKTFLPDMKTDHPTAHATTEILVIPTDLVIASKHHCEGRQQDIILALKCIYLSKGPLI
jgi:hypothetical protein